MCVFLFLFLFVVCKFGLFCQQTKDALAIVRWVNLAELIECVTRMRNERIANSHSSRIIVCRGCQQKTTNYHPCMFHSMKQRRTCIAEKNKEKRAQKLIFFSSKLIHLFVSQKVNQFIMIKLYGRYRIISKRNRTDKIICKTWHSKWIMCALGMTIRQVEVRRKPLAKGIPRTWKLQYRSLFLSFFGNSVFFLAPSHVIALSRLTKSRWLNSNQFCIYSNDYG